MWTYSYTAKEIAKILGISRNAVYKNLRKFREFGVEGLKTGRRKGRPRRIKSNYLKLLQSVRKEPPSSFGYQVSRWTLKLLRSHMARETGQFVSIEHLRRLLVKIDA